MVIFCDRRDEGGGPSAQGVKKEIEEQAKGEKAKGDRPARPKTDIHEPELLVGTRWVWEREEVARRFRQLGFIGGDGPPDKPAFLVATAAGEVGVDIDADQMVSDLVAWERMVQRLGRVNRRGKGDAEVVVLWSEPSVKNADAPTEAEKRALTAFACKDVLERLRTPTVPSTPALARCVGWPRPRARTALSTRASTRQPRPSRCVPP